jgi:hypothetical protein
MKKKKTDDGFLRGIWKNLSNSVKTAIVAAIVTALGVVFTPIRDRIIDFYPDKGKLSHIDGPDQVVLGETFQLDPFITPVGKLWHAGLRVHTPKTGVRPTKEQSIYTLGKIAEPTFFSRVYREPLTFHAVEVGKVQIACELLSDDRTLEQAMPHDVEVVRHHDYDGDWEVKVGDNKGTMHLETMPHDDTSVYGVYTLDTPTAKIFGLVNGKFDGSKFNGYLTYGESPARFQIQAESKDDDGTISVKGEAKLCEFATDAWRPVAGQPAFKLSMLQQKP